MIKEAPEDFPAVSLFSDAPHTHTDCPTIVAWRPFFKKSVALKWIVEHFSHFLMLFTFFLMIKFRLKLKIVRKTTRTFRYDLNQIPYDYTVEVTNRFKGLDLIEKIRRTMDGGSWHCTGGRDRDHPQEKEMQKGILIFRGGLTNSCEKKRSEKQRRKGKTFPFECRVKKNSKER